MSDTIDIAKVCRACLVDTGPFTNLHTLSSIESMYFSEIFTFCTSVTVAETDSLPKQICSTCIEIMKTYLKFKKMVLKSDMILKKQVNKQQQQFRGSVKIELIEVNMDMKKELGKDSSSDDEVLKPCTVKAEPLKYNKKKNDPLQITSTGHIKTTGDPLQMSNSIKYMQCPKCPKKFKNYGNFEAHIRIHFGKEPDTKCPTCGKVLSSYHNLNRHMQRHKNNLDRKYQCLTCGKRFAYQQILKTHEMIHANIKKHACHLCTAKFVQLSNLKVHLLTHKQERNYPCPHCEKKFVQPGNLKQHLMRHIGVKNIACTVCDKKFYIKSDLCKHMRSHSTERPYSCDFCDKTFKTDRFRVEHMRSHTGERPYACDLCPKRFMSTNVMRNHRMIHTGQKPYKCTLCPLGFIQKYALDRHMKSHSKIDEPQKPEDIQNQVMNRPTTSTVPTSVPYYHPFPKTKNDKD